MMITSSIYLYHVSSHLKTFQNKCSHSPIYINHILLVSQDYTNQYKYHYFRKSLFHFHALSMLPILPRNVLHFSRHELHIHQLCYLSINLCRNHHAFLAIHHSHFFWHLAILHHMSHHSSKCKHLFHVLFRLNILHSKYFY